MYPEEQLIALERRKAALRSKIARQRLAIADDVQELTRPISFLSGLRDRWQNLPLGLRLAATPLTAAVQRRLFGGIPVVGPSLLWVPTIVRAVKWLLPLLRQTRVVEPLGRLDAPRRVVARRLKRPRE